ncbi:SRPBCC family protein [Herbaspirillum sp. SJZ107]|uniref:SRPBCC family protein n=1 Tax=Herbaspirillum sp. SJZ107 TaxID=2572881 RepID=UPI001153B566|nr:SRPBCC family protein [Herbaspirillum sp. SJZ107]TQK08306.1 polyketide cyclase/dehydrase/lipid transport protein [Herbaspirillum sp. SJZ107]
MFASLDLRRARSVLSLALLLAAPVGSHAAPADDDIQVKVERHGESVTVHAQLSVPVDARQAFAVLTDYDHMKQFLPDLDESRILSRTRDGLLVRQAGKVRFGWFAVPFEYVRRVELTPDTRLVSHIVSGSVKKGDVTTTLTTSNGRTLITYDSEAAMGVWLPFGIGNGAIADHLRQDLDSMRTEMLRRKGAAIAAGAADAR